MRSYLLECLRRGYWNNRFEIEAREFAARHVATLHACSLRRAQPSSASRRYSRPAMSTSTAPTASVASTETAK